MKDMPKKGESFSVKLRLGLMPAKYWPYEEAFAMNYIAEMPVVFKTEEGEESEREWVYELHDTFCAAFGVGRDNKQTFGVWAMSWHGNEPPMLYFTFHDNNLYVGTGVRPYRGDTLPKPKTIQFAK